MAAEVQTTVSLLNSLTEALVSTGTAFPPDEQALIPPSDGISLLDVKNDLLLSYLQNLVFLIVLRLRNSRREVSDEGVNDNLNDEVVRKLVELRVYIDRGVRPLEGRLRYQIDKVLRAADEAERRESQGANISKKVGKKTSRSKKQINGTSQQTQSDVSDSASESADSNVNDDSDDDNMGQSEEEANEEIEETIYRPNVRAMASVQTQATKSMSGGRTQQSQSSSSSRTGAYKPPRITPTAMPSLSRSRDDGGHSTEAATSRRRHKSHLLNEYVNEELSSAPAAQPSIGSNNTITARGRTGLSERDRERERERTEYEERNFVRLPGESKADKRRARLRGERQPRDMFGGEDWTGLGGLGDRINRSVQLGRGGKPSVVERRQKRSNAPDTQDGQRGDGLATGSSLGFRSGGQFAKKRQMLEDRTERKRRKRG